MEGSLLDETLQLPVEMMILERINKIERDERGVPGREEVNERPEMTRVEPAETGRKVNREQFLDRFDIFRLTQLYSRVS